MNAALELWCCTRYTWPFFIVTPAPTSLAVASNKVFLCPYGYLATTFPTSLNKISNNCCATCSGVPESPVIATFAKIELRYPAAFAAFVSYWIDPFCPWRFPSIARVGTSALLFFEEEFNAVFSDKAGNPLIFLNCATLAKNAFLICSSLVPATGAAGVCCFGFSASVFVAVAAFSSLATCALVSVALVSSLVGAATTLLSVPATGVVCFLAKSAGLSAGFSLSEVFGLATVVSAVFGASTGFVFSAGFVVFSVGAVAAGCSFLASVPYVWSRVAEVAVWSFLSSVTGVLIAFLLSSCFSFTSSVAIS